MLSRLFLRTPPVQARTMVSLYYRQPAPKPYEQPRMSYLEYERSVNAQFRVESHLPTFKYPLRTGLIGYKQGMTSIYNKWAVSIPCTVIQVDRCQVLDVKTKEKNGVNALQVGAGERAIELVKKPTLGLFLKAGVPPKRDIKEFHVTPDNVLPVGYMITPRHFSVGQYVDVQGISKGKGFQGWNFAGQRRSHGNSKAHRKVGSIGQRTTPAKVWKGKKMPGRMGGESSTVQNMIVIRVDCPRSLIYLKGAIPGTIGSCVYIKDAVKRIAKQYKRLQYPTFVPEDGVEYPDVETIRESKLDPSDVYRHENNIEGDNFDEEEEDEDDVVVDETGTICADDDLE